MSQTICVIDDDLEVCDTIRLTFETRNYAVHVATSGDEGLAMLHDKQPDLILLDLVLPEMNGFELLGEIRRMPGKELTPVIIITSLAQDVSRSEEEWRRRLGVTDFLKKPFALTDLLKRVRAALHTSEEERIS